MKSRTDDFAQLSRFNLHETFMHAYTTGKARARVERLFDEVDREKLAVPQGGSTPITTLRTRWSDEAVVTGTAESEELDFNIALRQGIEIFQVYCRIQIAGLTAVDQFMHALVDLDGPALANNAIATLAAYDLRAVLESVIANFGIGTDALGTAAGAQNLVLQNVNFPIPILTARNPGIARNSLTGSGRALIGLQHRFVEINRDENLELFALGRA